MIDVKTPHFYSTDSSSTPYISYGQDAGQLRFSTLNQCLEVFDGTAWVAMVANSELHMTPRSEQALDWAIKKMEEEEELQRRLEKNPALKEAYDAFKVIEALSREYDGNSKS